MVNKQYITDIKKEQVRRILTGVPVQREKINFIDSDTKYNYDKLINRIRRIE